MANRNPTELDDLVVEEVPLVKRSPQQHPRAFRSKIKAEKEKTNMDNQRESAELKSSRTSRPSEGKTSGINLVQDVSTDRLNELVRSIELSCRDEMRAVGQLLIDDIRRELKGMSLMPCHKVDGDAWQEPLPPMLPEKPSGDFRKVPQASNHSAGEKLCSGNRHRVVSPTDLPGVLNMGSDGDAAADGFVKIRIPKWEQSDDIQSTGIFFSDPSDGSDSDRSDVEAWGSSAKRSEMRKKMSTTITSNGGENPKGGRLCIERELTRKTVVAPKRFWVMTLDEFVKSSTFDNLAGMAILLNAGVIGVQTDYNAIYMTDTPTVTFRVLEYLFCCWFTSELLLRLKVFGGAFFKPCSEGWLWNYFDTFIVIAQLLEMAVEALSSSGNFDMGNFRLLRMLRVLRLVRILRVVRVLHLISELRAIMSSIIGSFKSLVWVVVLLLLMIYIVAIYFTQSITDHMVEQSQALDDHWAMSDEEIVLRTYFGSLTRGILSLWQAMSGGLDWDTLASPLFDEISWMTGMAFCCFIAFALLALMNVVTGVFVQTALQSARDEEDSFMTSQILNLFKITDKERDTRITMDEIEESIEDPKAEKEWKSIGVEAADARYLFNLLDVEGSGHVVFEEFLGGCLRLNGSAKSIDLLTIMQESRNNCKSALKHNEETRRHLSNMKSRLRKLETLVSVGYIRPEASRSPSPCDDLDRRMAELVHLAEESRRELKIELDTTRTRIDTLVAKPLVQQSPPHAFEQRAGLLEDMLSELSRDLWSWKHSITSTLHEIKTIVAATYTIQDREGETVDVDALLREGDALMETI
eukprot:TRINITY_DN43294_c0_g1_i1.p1 TRINITY_DN43294_c0_g1~~TRINITY_DN43294_c0_g1_i1.p1  ORF type:complete len:841 (+),score=116.82 TRINITY_DN43294_c0_g1_i1:103-2523(+)